MVGGHTAAGEHKHGHVVGTGAGSHGGEAVGGRQLVVVGRKAAAIGLPNAFDGAQSALLAVDRKPTGGLFGQGGDASAPVFQTRVELSASRHDDVQAPQGVNGHQWPINHDLLCGRSDQVGGKFAIEGFADVLFAVESDENIGGFVFAGGVCDARHGVDRSAAVSLHAHPHSGGHLGGVVQSAARFYAAFGVVIEHDCDGGELRRCARCAQHQRHVRQRDEHVRIAQRDNDRILVGRRVFLRGFARKHDLPRCAIGEG